MSTGDLLAVLNLFERAPRVIKVLIRDQSALKKLIDSLDIAARERDFRGLGFADPPCYARALLTPGMAFGGPAIVDQGDATTLVAPGVRARVDHAHNIILELS